MGTLSESERGAAFERVVQHYLTSDPIYQAKLAHVWLLADVPVDISATLNLPSRDMGIDLVAQTHVGEFWAIQAKFRADADASLTFADLSTFAALAFTVCRGFSYGLVCTTTMRVPGILTGLPSVGDLTGEIWSALGAEFFRSFVETLRAEGMLSRPLPRVPRPHQERAIAAGVAHFRSGVTRGKLISPCGSGKSLTACWIARQLGARRVLIAVPSLALIRQTLETWMREALAADEPADWLCVCSDDGVTEIDTAELVAHVHELGIPCETSVAALSGHLRSASDRPAQLVVLTTYQSSGTLAAAARDAGTEFDFAVFDEAHKTTGRGSSMFAHLLFDENLALPRRLFMTATERRFLGSSDDIVSMDDPALYGETFEILTFKEAIAAQPPILSDYRVLTIGVRESEVARLIEDRRWLDLGADGLDEVTAVAVASLIALRRAAAEHGVQHTVSFHSSIARARQFRDLCSRLNGVLDGESPIGAFHVSGQMGSAARQREIERFLAAERSLITNARCLTEGVDVPRIDCVFFADPKGSTIEIVQASGRALRLAEGKTLGHILLPLVVRDGAALDEVAGSSAFKFVLFVLRALAAHDERIIEWFRATAEGRSPEVGGLVRFDLGHVATPLGVEPMEFASQIGVKCWESVAKLAYLSYDQAVAFAALRKLKTQAQWNAAHRTPGADWPADIPRSPDKSYAGRGWISWGAFLGTGAVGTKLKRFKSFEDARAWARCLGLQSSVDWNRFRNGKMESVGALPPDVPYCPDRTYKRSGWTSWDDFLGVDWRPFAEAREFARSLKLAGQQHWKAYCAGKRPDLPAKPDDIPASPAYGYEGRGWESWGDWLGNGYVAATKRNYRPYAEARVYARRLGLSSRGEWMRLADGRLDGREPLPSDIPRRPDRVYAKDGFDWSDWLGCEVRTIVRVRRKPSRFRDFESARAFARNLGLRGSLEWPRYTRGELADKPPIPSDIPRNPANVYRGSWQGWGDWLGTGNVAPFAKTFRSFEDARTFARTLGFRVSDEWRQWVRVPGNRPPDIPSNPSGTYKDKGWINWEDFLQPPAPAPASETASSSA